MLISETLRHGPDNQLPAHLAEVLGLSHGGHTVAVKQAVRRDGTTVHIFNVCLDKKSSVVLINVNEASDLSRVYLISRNGVLNKAVSYHTGAPPASRSVKEAQDDLDRELAVWTGS